VGLRGVFFFLPFFLSGLVGLAVRFLVGISGSSLVDLGAYELGTFFSSAASSLVFWSLVFAGGKLCFFFFPLFGSFLVSWERFYRNAW
jgi:hypothetical protein